MEEITTKTRSDRAAEVRRASGDRKNVKRDIVLLCVSGAALAMSVICRGLFPADPAWIAVVLCGAPIVFDAASGPTSLSPSL